MNNREYKLIMENRWGIVMVDINSLMNTCAYLKDYVILKAIKPVNYRIYKLLCLSEKFETGDYETNGKPDISKVPAYIFKFENKKNGKTELIEVEKQ